MSDLRDRAREIMEERGWSLFADEERIFVRDHGRILSEHEDVESALRWIVEQGE